MFQNPSAERVAAARAQTGDTGRQTANPDYLVEGRVFDCYSPDTGTAIRNIWSEVSRKAKNRQTQRVVINLRDWGDEGLPALRQQFADWPVAGLREVKALTSDGTVVPIWHS